MSSTSLSNGSPSTAISFSIAYTGPGTAYGVGFSGGNLIVPASGAGNFMYWQPYDATGTPLTLTAMLGQTKTGMLYTTPTKIVTASNGFKTAYVDFNLVYTAQINQIPTTVVSANDAMAAAARRALARHGIDPALVPTVGCDGLEQEQ